MTTQYTSILKLALPVQGELSGTWGDVVNDNITSMVEEAVAGRAVINTWTTNSHTLTTADGTTAESRCAMLEFTDTGTALTGAATVVCPSLSKLYVCKNDAGQQVTIKTSAGTGVAIPDGQTMFVFCDGTNVEQCTTNFNSLSFNDYTLSFGGAVTTAGAFTTSGAYALTLTTTGATNVTLPTTGTLATLAGTETLTNKTLTAPTISSPTLTGSISATDLTISGDTTIGDAAADGLTVNATITSNLIFTDNTYDIGASGATRPRNLFLAGNATIGGTVTLSGGIDVTGALGVDGDFDVNTDKFTVASASGNTAVAGTLGVTGVTTATGGLNVDTINEITAAGGVTIDSVVLKDGGATLTDDLIVDTDTLFVDVSADRVGINEDEPDEALVVRAADYSNSINGGIAVQAGDHTGSHWKTAFKIKSSSGGVPRTAIDVSIDSSGGVYEALSMYSSEVVVNEDSADKDFRIESNSNTHMLFVDAGNDQVAVGTSSLSDSGFMFGVQGNVTIGDRANSVAGTYNSLELSGYPLNDTSADYGSYGALRFYANTTYTSGARRVLLTNAYKTNQFGFLIGDTDPTSEPNVIIQGNPTNALVPLAFENTGTVVVNQESAAGVDFRVESDGYTHALFVDASADNVGVKINAPQSALHINENGGPQSSGDMTTGLIVSNGTAGTAIQMGTNDVGGYGFIKSAYVNSSQTGRALLLYTGTTKAVSVESGETVINDDSHDRDFRVESDNRTHMVFVDGGEDVVKLGWNNATVPSYVGIGSVMVSDNIFGYQGGDTANSLYNISVDDNYVYYLHNAYYTTGGWTQRNAGFAPTMYRQGSGSHQFEVANDAGSDDTGISWRPLLKFSESGGFVWNENSYNTDFKIESDGNANMVYVDASANAVGIGKLPDSAGNYALDVDGAIRFGDGTVLAGIAYPNIVTTTRSVGTGNQWFMVYEETVSPSPRTVWLKVTASGDNTSWTGDFVVNLAGYNFQHSVTLTDYQYYNVSKLEEIKTVNPGGGTTTQIWVRLSAITTSVGTLTVACSSSALVSSLSAGSEPSATTGTVHLYNNSWPSNSSRVNTVFGNGAEFADASVARFRRQDGTRSSYINHDTGGMNIATSNTGDNMDITVAGGSLDVTLGDNYEMAVNEGSAAADFRVESNDNTNMFLVDGTSNVALFGISAHSWTSNNVAIFNPSTGGMGITANGDWGLQMAGSTAERIRFFSSAGGSSAVGNIQASTTGVSYNTTSDIRLKENIETITDGTDKLMAMNPVTHTWKETPNESSVHGFIAQEMQEIVPEAVSGDPDGEEMMSMDYGRITPVLVAALQDAHRKIEALEERLAGLEAQ